MAKNGNKESINNSKSAGLELLSSKLVSYLIQKAMNDPSILVKSLQQGGQNLNDTIKSLRIY